LRERIKVEGRATGKKLSSKLVSPLPCPAKRHRTPTGSIPARGREIPAFILILYTSM